MNNEDQKVTPFRSEAKSLKPRALTLFENTTWAGEIVPNLDRDYIVKGWLDRGALSVVYGPSNVGKSFLAVDLAHHVSKGHDWGDRRVRQGNVLYLAPEGGALFANRVAALADPVFWVLPIPIAFTGRATDAQPLTEMIHRLSEMHGAFDLIVIDTMARVMGAVDENTAPAIAELLRNIDLVKRETGAHVMLIHHTGKDVLRGARGHSSLRAAVDTEIELTRDECGKITAEVTKQRDGSTGYRFYYTLRQVELGRDLDGDPVTTCVVEPALPAEAGRVDVSQTGRKALGILDKLIAERGEVRKKPAYPGTPCVSLADWRDSCVKPGVLSDADKRDTRRRAFNREKEALIAGGVIMVRDDLVWRVEQ